METIFTAIAERQAELAGLPQGVKNWVQFMRLLFFSGIVFVPWWKAPRWVIVTMIATAAGIVASKIFIPGLDTIMAGSLVQLVLWIPLAAYLLSQIRPTTIPALASGKPWSMLFGLWMAVVTLVVLVSTALNSFNVARAFG